MTNNTQHTTETYMRNSSMTQRSAKASLKIAGLTAALALVATITGCSSGIPTDFGVSQPVSTYKLTGMVHGGQNPIAFSTIHLYTVGTSGLNSAATDITNTLVQTDANGNYTLTGKYSCANATDVYLVAQGGNPGSGTNSAITLAAALGPCANLTSSTYTVINEVTTVAAAYAFAPFASGYANVGANFGGSTTVVPTGLATAFSNAFMLADTTIGVAGNAALATGVTVPVAEINGLGNIIASCINTTGPSSSACMALFSATGASDTFGAALAIAKNPGAPAITALYAYTSYQGAPFQPIIAYSSAPNDFSVAVTMAGSAGTLATPYGIAIDASGNAWVANESGASLTAFSPLGTAGTTTATGLVGAEGVAVDKSGNVWVANTAGNSVIKFTPSSASYPVSGTVSVAGSFTAGGITGPSAVAIDSANDVFVANLNGNSVTELSGSTGAALNSSPFTGSGNISVPTGIAVAQSGGSAVYVTSGNGTVVQLTNAGVYSASLNDGVLQGPFGVTTDPTGHVEATGFTTGSAVGYALSEFSGGTASTISPVSSGLSNPAGIATDGTSIWVANGSSSGGLAKFSYGSATPASPTAGYGALNAPVGVAVDASGSVWTANSGANTVSKFIGIAAPVVTPIAANVAP